MLSKNQTHKKYYLADDKDSVEYEYYEEEEGVVGNRHIKVKDVNDEFIVNEETTGAVFDEGCDTEEHLIRNEGDATSMLGGRGLPTGRVRGLSSLRWGERTPKVEEEAADSIKQSKAVISDGDNLEIGYKNAAEHLKSRNTEVVDKGKEGAIEVEDEDSLYTTPLPTPANENGTRPQTNFQLVNRTPSTIGVNVEGSELEESAEESCGDSKRDKKEDTEEDLLKVPMTHNFQAKESANASAKKSCRAATEKNWWNNRPQQRPDKGQISEKRKQWSPITSFSKASFISSPFCSRTSSSSSLFSPSLGVIYSSWLASLSRALGVVFQKARTVIHTAFAAVRHSLHFVWAWPVEDVTMTGISAQKRGIHYFMVPSSPAMLFVSSCAALGTATFLYWRPWDKGATVHEDGQRLRWNHFWRKKFVGRYDECDDEEDPDTGYASMPPSVEEELKFLYREFIPANPATRDWIIKTIAAKRHRAPQPAPKSQKGQWKFTMKSILRRWKRQPRPQTVAIVDPPSPPSSPEVQRLDVRLTAFEQERDAARQDARLARQKLRQVQRDARTAVTQKKWLKHHTSRAEQRPTRFLEFERQKADEEI